MYGGSQYPHHSAISGLLWYFYGDLLPGENSPCPRYSRLFAGFEPTLFTANHLNAGLSLIRNPQTGVVAGSIRVIYAQQCYSFIRTSVLYFYRSSISGSHFRQIVTFSGTEVDLLRWLCIRTVAIGQTVG